MLTLISCANK